MNDKPEHLELTPLIEAASLSESFTLLHEVLQNTTLTWNDRLAIEQVYRRMLPKTPAPPETALKWLADCLADRHEERAHLRRIQVYDYIAYASDGYRMAWIPTDVSDGAHHISANSEMLRLSESADVPGGRRYTEIISRNCDIIKGVQREVDNTYVWDTYPEVKYKYPERFKTYTIAQCRHVSVYPDKTCAQFAVKIGPCWFNLTEVLAPFIEDGKITLAFDEENLHGPAYGSHGFGQYLVMPIKDDYK